MSALNTKTFILAVKSSKTFQVVISGFSKSSQWFIEIKNLFITIVATLNMSLKGTSTISLDTLRMDLGTMFLTTKIASQVALLITMNASANLIYSISVAANNLISIEYILRQQTGVLSAINLNIAIVADALKVTLITLATHDVKTLGTMDVDSLGDLDFAIIP